MPDPSLRLYVLLLGPFELRAGERPLDVTSWPKRAASLFRMLASTDGKRRLREEVAEILWPESAPEAAAGNLRFAIHRLRATIGAEDVRLARSERGWVALNPDIDWDVDLDEAARVVESGAADLATLLRAARLFRGEPLIEDRYEDWALPVRTHARGLWRELCLRLSDAYMGVGESKQAAQWGTRLLEEDPLDEAAVQRVLVALAAAGLRPEGLRIFKEFEQRLRDDLDVAPSQETIALAAGLRSVSAPLPLKDEAGERPVGADGAVELGARPVEGSTNLPDDPTPFVGRRRELAALAAVMHEPGVRLVTLTGPGGTGKTRLAMRLGRDLLPSFPDGAFFVPLAAVSEPEALPAAVANALGVRVPQGASPRAVVTDYLRDRTLLLILDNFEQLLEGGQIVADLLDLCVHVRVIVTSREVLRLTREHVVDVPPLEVPDAGERLDLEALLDYDAVALFTARARAAQAAFTLTAENADVVAEICRRLDGLPLAIELAAARVRHFPPRALLARLSSRLDLLTGGARDLPARQQTLRRAIQWSYDLLDDGEQALFARLSVFAGGCTVGAAVAVCAPEAGELAVLDGLTSLVDKSLLRHVEGVAGEPRFLMLQTIREYAAERLAERDEMEAIRRAHAEHFVDMVRRVASETSFARIGAVPSHASLPLIEQENANLDAAIRWAVERGHFGLAFQLSFSVATLWRDLGRFGELVAWWDLLKSHVDETAGLTRAQALMAAAYYAPPWTDPQILASIHREALEVFRAEADGQELLYALISIAGMNIFGPGDRRLSGELFPEAIRLGRELGSQSAVAAALRGQAEIAHHEYGDVERSKELFRESLEIERGLGHMMGVAYSLHGLVWLALLEGDNATVRTVGRETAELYRELNNRTELDNANFLLAVAALRMGDDREVLALVREGRAAARVVRDPRLGVRWLNPLGAVAAARGLPETAARVWGAFEGFREREAGAWIDSSDEQFFVALKSVVRSSLGEDAWRAEMDAGRLMTIDEALDYGLDVVDAVAPAGPSQRPI